MQFILQKWIFFSPPHTHTHARMHTRTRAHTRTRTRTRTHTHRNKPKLYKYRSQLLSFHSLPFPWSRSSSNFHSYMNNNKILLSSWFAYSKHWNLIRTTPTPTYPCFIIFMEIWYRECNVKISEVLYWNNIAFHLKLLRTKWMQRPCRSRHILVLHIRKQLHSHCLQFI